MQAANLSPATMLYEKWQEQIENWRLTYDEWRLSTTTSAVINDNKQGDSREVLIEALLTYNSFYLYAGQLMFDNEKEVTNDLAADHDRYKSLVQSWLQQVSATKEKAELVDIKGNMLPILPEVNQNIRNTMAELALIQGQNLYQFLEQRSLSSVSPVDLEKMERSGLLLQQVKDSWRVGGVQASLDQESLKSGLALLQESAGYMFQTLNSDNNSSLNGVSTTTTLTTTSTESLSSTSSNNISTSTTSTNTNLP